MSDLTRSPLLLDVSTSALLVVDVQQRLLPLIPSSAEISARIGWLIEAAKRFSVPTMATEQYPQGLGTTIPELRTAISAPPREKRMFSCRECSDIFQGWHAAGRRQVVVVGIETHVCVLQTVLDLLSLGFDCYVVVDATGSRHLLDQQIALQRMEISGGMLTTTEAVLFEWCADSRDPNFKQISQWVKQGLGAGPAPVLPQDQGDAKANS
jgi:nicotinamidase-related amidase